MGPLAFSGLRTSGQIQTVGSVCPSFVLGGLKWVSCWESWWVHGNKVGVGTGGPCSLPPESSHLQPRIPGLLSKYPHKRWKEGHSILSDSHPPLSPQYLILALSVCEFHPSRCFSEAVQPAFTPKIGKCDPRVGRGRSKVDFSAKSF